MAIKNPAHSLAGGMCLHNAANQEANEGQAESEASLIGKTEIICSPIIPLMATGRKKN